ncbi:Fructosamine kinase-domain-containing protein [Apiospora saccharicola]|uniref:protein-ribulosamine 3-kinase n=1 Tax=Apiospora saccharicola TaxID=335842 RepID=A0ABR1W134_9PEZI
MLEGIPWGASAWTTTYKYKVTAELADGTRRFFFVKTAKGPFSAVVMEGEFNSLQSISSVSPGLVPQVHGWGKMTGEPDTYFLAMDFLDLNMTLPGPTVFGLAIADLHRNSTSPTGKFGFSTPTCHGRHVQPNDWDESWSRYFSRLLTSFFEIYIGVNGHWREYEEAFATLRARVIPRILEPLQADGRVLKPCLVHGDLWEDNTGIDVNTGGPVIYDASAMYAHNEYELGMWRQNGFKIGSEHIEAYLQQYPPSEPAYHFDDRNRLYSIKFKLAHSSGWPGLTDTRKT